MKVKKADFIRLFEERQAIDAVSLADLDLSDFGVSPEESILIKRDWKFVGLSNWQLLLRLVDPKCKDHLVQMAMEDPKGVE